MRGTNDQTMERLKICFYKFFLAGTQNTVVIHLIFQGIPKNRYQQKSSSKITHLTRNSSSFAPKIAPILIPSPFLLSRSPLIQNITHSGKKKPSSNKWNRNWPWKSCEKGLFVLHALHFYANTPKTRTIECVFRIWKARTHLFAVTIRILLCMLSCDGGKVLRIYSQF